MALSERLAIIITADTGGAVRNIEALGKTADRDLSRATRAAEGFSARMDALGRRMIVAGSAATVFGATATPALFSVVKEAAALGDAIQASDVIFGRNLSASIDQFARNAEQKLGLSRKAATEALTAFGTFGLGAGLDGRELLAFSSGLVQAATDLVSLKGVTTDEVIQSISSGLAGEIEPLRRLGIQITDVQKRVEAVRLGLRKAGESAPLTPQQNVLATESLIRQSPLGQAASGDFERTLDSLPNQLRVATAEFENLKTELGEGMIPVFKSLVSGATAVNDIFQRLPEGVQTFIGTAAAAGAVGSLVFGPIVTLGGGALRVLSGFGKEGGLASRALSAITSSGGAASTVIGKLGVTTAGLAAAAGGAATAIGLGLGVYEAWSSEAAQVEAQIKKLKDAIDIASGADVAPALAERFSDILDVNKGGVSAFRDTGLAISDVVAAVDAAPGSFDKFRDSVDGTFRPLANLGDPIFGLLDPVEKLRAAAEDAGPGVASVIDDLIGAFESGKIDSNQFRQVVDYITDLDKAASGSAESVALQAEQLEKAAGSAARTAEAQRLLKIATDESAGLAAQRAALTALQSLFRDAAIELGQVSDAAAGVGPAAASSTSGLSAMEARMRAAADAAGEGATKLQQYQAAARAANEPARAAISAGQALLRVEQARERLAQLDDPRVRDEEVRSSLDRVTSAQDGLTAAIERRAKAQEELNRLTKRSAVAGSVPLLQEISRAADAGVKDAQARLDRVRAEFGGESAEAKAAEKAVEAATGRRTEGLGLLNKALAEQGGVNQRERREALREIQSADRDIAKAQRDRQDAEREYAEVLTSGGEAARDRAAAALDLAAAELDLDEARAAVAGFAADGVDVFAELGERMRDVGAGDLADDIGRLGDRFAFLTPTIAAIIGIVEKLQQPGGLSLFGIDLNGGAGTGATSGGAVTVPSGVGGRTSTIPLPSVGAKWDGYVWNGREWVLDSTPSARPAVRGGTRRLADGGIVVGTGVGDTVPAMLTPGEFVLTRQAVKTIGVDRLEELNKMTQTPTRFATGGLVGRGSASVLTAPALSGPARETTSTSRVEIKPTINIQATDPKQAADETIRRMRRSTFLAGVR